MLTAQVDCKGCVSLRYCAGVLTYQHYGSRRVVKALAWTAAVVLALLIISARKHYTVDVVIAWYVVPLAYCCLNMYWKQQQQQQQWLPVAVSGTFVHPCCSQASDPGCVGFEGSPGSCNCVSPLPMQLTCKTGKGTSPALGSPVYSGDPQDTIITVGASTAWKVPASLSARSPTTPEGYPDAAAAELLSWPSRLGAVWQATSHRRAGSNSSGASTGSLLSRDSGSPHYGYVGSGRLQSDDSVDC